jgi:hypothetical protein
VERGDTHQMPMQGRWVSLHARKANQFAVRRVGLVQQRSKRALQATAMAAIDNAARLDRDWLSRGMSDIGSIRAHARGYKELKKDITWPLPA